MQDVLKLLARSRTLTDMQPRAWLAILAAPPFTGQSSGAWRSNWSASNSALCPRLYEQMQRRRPLSAIQQRQLLALRLVIRQMLVVCNKSVLALCDWGRLVRCLVPALAARVVPWYST
jgi:hypothetical protein